MDAASLDDAVARTGAPGDRARETLDVADDPPPAPLQATLERLPELDDDVVLVQVNDRAPQHLYPKLDERGYAHDTVEVEEGVVTTVWRP